MQNNTENGNADYSPQIKKADVNKKLEYHILEILKLLGTTKDEVLQETPRRLRKLLQERTSSTRESIDREILKTFEVKQAGLVLVKDIEVNSMCEHHLMPFFGTAAVAYYPKTQVLGLSKISRIVEYCNKKLNLQEILTQDIVDTLDQAVENDGICVLIKCKHFCMVLNDTKSKGETITIVKTGKFKEDPAAFKEFQGCLKL
jgi:GTP cyclohydrolase I